jgi:hypothetical protein
MLGERTLKIPKLHKLIVVLVCMTGAAQAQESNFDISVGLKPWRTQWTTFGYNIDDFGTLFLTQLPAKDKTVFIPLLSARYRDFVASISGFAPTDFELPDGAATRKEFDANVGWLFTPGVAATIGYKKVGQTGAAFTYNLTGPTVGLSATAPVRGAFSLYGTLGLGRMKSTGDSTVEFDADYQLSEVGFAYTLALGGIPRALTFTLGYRMQTWQSKEALVVQGDRTVDAHDVTQGLTLGLVARF